MNLKYTIYFFIFLWIGVKPIFSSLAYVVPEQNKTIIVLDISLFKKAKNIYIFSEEVDPKTKKLKKKQIHKIQRDIVYQKLQYNLHRFIPDVPNFINVKDVQKMLFQHSDAFLLELSMHNLELQNLIQSKIVINHAYYKKFYILERVSKKQSKIIKVLKTNSISEKAFQKLFKVKIFQYNEGYGILVNTNAPHILVNSFNFVKVVNSKYSLNLLKANIRRKENKTENLYFFTNKKLRYKDYIQIKFQLTGGVFITSKKYIISTDAKSIPKTTIPLIPFITSVIEKNDQIYIKWEYLLPNTIKHYIVYTLKNNQYEKISHELPNNIKQFNYNYKKQEDAIPSKKLNIYRFKVKAFLKNGEYSESLIESIYINIPKDKNLQEVKSTDIQLSQNNKKPKIIKSQPLFLASYNHSYATKNTYIHSVHLFWSSTLNENIDKIVLLKFQEGNKIPIKIPLESYKTSYVDKNILLNTTYQYQIQIYSFSNNHKEIFTLSNIEEVHVFYEIPLINKFVLSISNQSIKIIWNSTKYNLYNLSFKVLKSFDGVNFKEITKEPISSKLSYYIDTTTQRGLNIEYFYRLIPMINGEEGIPSIIKSVYY